MSRRRGRALATVLLLTGAVASTGSPAVGEDIRTATDLGGFSVHVDGGPIKVLADDPSNPLPRPEDAAIVEADPAFTLAEVATGPAARGLSSSLWPGNLLGEGLGAATNGQAPNYPVKADARYPDKPFAADDPAGGNAMHATAAGLEALATSNRGAMSIPGSVDVGSMTSQSTAVVDKDDVAIGRTTSRVSDIDLLGTIKIGSVSTVVETRSDGKKQTSTGRTVVSGLTIAGQQFVVDDDGAHAVGGPGTGPLPLGALDAVKAAGITISGIGQTVTNDADGVRRDAKGLRITVDTTLYRKALTDATPGAVTSAIYDAFGALPLPPQAQTYRSFLYYTLSATPKITFVIGAGSSATVANLPLSFDVPSFPDLPPAVGPAGGGLFPPSAVPGGGAPVTAPLDPGAPSAPEVGTGAAPAPDVAGTPTTPLAAETPPDPFAGISAWLLLGALLAAGLGGFGLMRLRGAAFLGAAGAGGCTLGAPSSVPDLRGASS